MFKVFFSSVFVGDATQVCLSHLTIDHASLSRRSTVPTPNRHLQHLGAHYRLVQAYNPNFLQSPMSTQFLRDRPIIFSHVFNVHLPSLFTTTFFCRQIFGFLYCLGTLGLTGSHISSYRKRNNRKRLERGTLNTCAILRVLSLKNDVDIWTFVH